MRNNKRLFLVRNRHVIQNLCDNCNKRYCHKNQTFTTHTYAYIDGFVLLVALPTGGECTVNSEYLCEIGTSLMIEFNLFFVLAYDITNVRDS